MSDEVTPESEMETAINEILGARSLLLGWRKASTFKSVRGEGMLASARMLIGASAAAARAAIAVANEAHYVAEGLSGTGEDLRLTAESLEAHCTKVEAEAWGIFREMSDEAEERGEWGGHAMTRVLLITGARSLADDPAAEAWARGLIAAALVGVDLLIVGDAPGPDAWAMYEGRDLSHGVHVYWTRGKDAGWILAPDGEGEASYEGRWAPPGTPTGPLARNAAMVSHAARMLRDGHDVRCLALLDGRKPAVVQPGEKRPTRGTEHTARLARAAGLTVDAQTWPKGATT